MAAGGRRGGLDRNSDVRLVHRILFRSGRPDDGGTPDDGRTRTQMNPLLKEIRHNPLLWLLIFVPVVFVAEKLKHESHTLLFVLSVLAIVPLATLLSHATASIAGAIVTNTLFMLGASFLLGGLKYHVQEYNRVSARLQAGLLFLATVALVVPSAISQADSAAGAAFTQKLSVGLSVLLIAGYGLGM